MNQPKVINIKFVDEIQQFVVSTHYHVYGLFRSEKDALEEGHSAASALSRGTERDVQLTLHGKVVSTYHRVEGKVEPERVDG